MLIVFTHTHMLKHTICTFIHTSLAFKIPGWFAHQWAFVIQSLILVLSPKRYWEMSWQTVDDRVHFYS